MRNLNKNTDFVLIFMSRKTIASFNFCGQLMKSLNENKYLKIIIFWISFC